MTIAQLVAPSGETSAKRRHGAVAFLVPACTPAMAFVLAVVLVSSACTGQVVVADHPAGVAAATPSSASDGAAVTVTVDTGAASIPSHLQLGVTHTQHSIDDRADPVAAARAKAYLVQVHPVQNQHAMGWGAGNPEPAPGVFDFGSLDARIALISATGSEPMITLCCAPDWMKGGDAATTDWSRLEIAPKPAHFPDFADLAAQIAARYPTVHRFQIWNELKGFFDHATNTWDAAAFTTLYNLVYDAVKRVRPDALIGGPYVVLDSRPEAAGVSHPSAVTGPWGVLDGRPLEVVAYWLAHRHGADFVAVDGSSMTVDGVAAPDEFGGLAKFAAATAWLRAHTDLPVVWSEWYVQPTGADWTPAHQAAVATQALITFARAGVTLALLWQPEGDGGACHECLWTARTTPVAGVVTPLADAYASFAAGFPPGTGLVGTASTSPDVDALASSTTILLVNHTDAPIEVDADHHRVRLTPWQVATVTR